MNKVLVIAPHPDDEVLGCGGTIRRLVNEGFEVTVAIATKGTPLFPASQVKQVRSEARKAAKRLGVEKLLFLDLPVTTLHLIPEHKLNKTFIDLIAKKVKPDIVFLPYQADRHEDHRQIFDAAMVAMRPDGRNHQVSRICCYETVSETHWSVAGIESPFDPNSYIDISETLKDKLEAMRLYKSQLDAKIPARSIEAIESLARFRGSVVGMPAAEAFLIIRDLWPAQEAAKSKK
jgi:LmbE family N-acetylglucosaminyl deacetylase